MHGELISGAAIFEERNPDEFDVTNVKHNFINFIKQYNIGNSMIYKDQLIRNYNQRMYYLEVSMQDIKLQNTKLFQDIYDKPNESLRACEECINKICEEISASMPGESSFSLYDIKSWQIVVNIDKNPTPIKQVDTA